MKEKEHLEQVIQQQQRLNSMDISHTNALRSVQQHDQIAELHGQINEQHSKELTDSCITRKKEETIIRNVKWSWNNNKGPFTHCRVKPRI